LGVLGFGGIDAPADAATSTLPLRSQYLNSVGCTFTAVRGRHVYRVKLAHIRDVTGATTAMRNTSFNLIFTTSSALPDGVYTIGRRGVPVHSLFLSRIGAYTSTSSTMQALINRTVIK
jgi:hypothetical protein